MYKGFKERSRQLLGPCKHRGLDSMPQGAPSSAVFPSPTSQVLSVYGANSPSSCLTWQRSLSPPKALCEEQLYILHCLSGSTLALIKLPFAVSAPSLANRRSILQNHHKEHGKSSQERPKKSEHSRARINCSPEKRCKSPGHGSQDC